MYKLLEPVSEKEFSSICTIKIHNILEGMNDYKYGILEVKDPVEEEKTFESYNLKYEDRFINFLEKVYDINKEESVMVDFYLKNIEADGILKMLDVLDYEDRLILINHLKYLKGENIYFKISHKDLMPFITRLSTRELHFCTIYFNKIPLVVWGNYNLSFPIFCKEQQQLDFYRKVAEDYGIFMRK